ncbi:hypothetical protein QAD02_006305 [Eretmocerus hayati]|uniref:Uncharacterized protein n=1 Tax=Eretmocerus hayati TaxID=131215 RepID=A0ACC2N0J4_9HYME|nr:hypothetical protein QAD02_006305 [Eretmocerus hayati]
MDFKIFVTSCFLLYSTKYSLVVSLEGSNIKNVKGNEYPFVVSLSYKPSHTDSKKNNHFCGGTLISKKHVLTAKHCLEDESIADIQVMTRPLGWFLKKPKVFSVKSVDTYEGWARARGKSSVSCLEDLAILELDTDDTKITPVTISAFQDPPADASIVMIGYDIFKEAVSPPITKATLKVISNQNCLDRLKKYVPHPDELEVFDYLMCAMAKPWTVATPGDSGAPILDSIGFLVGVHISICPCWEKCSKNSVPVNLSLRVRYYLDFIEDVTKINLIRS